MHRRSQTAAFTLPELIALLAVIVLVAVLFLPALSHRHPKPLRIMCVSNLKNVGLAFRIFATDHNDKFPGAILSSNVTDLASIRIESILTMLSNELSTPKLLHCPADKKRKEAPSFQNLIAQNISYFVSLSSDETRPQSLLAGDRNMLADGKPASKLLPLTTNTALSWSKEMHVEQGNIAMGDGSVQQMSNSRLQQSLRDALEGVSTDHLLFPP